MMKLRSRISLSGVVGVAVASGIVVSDVAVAQQVLASTAEVVVQDDRPAKNVLDRTITVRLSGVSLEAALQEIGRQAGAQIMYSQEVVPVERRVSVAGEGMPLRTVLERVLQGTSLVAQLSRAGSVMITRDTRRTQGIVTGRVTHAKTGQPVSGATVTIGTSSVTTGDDGTFRLEAPAGEHTVQIRSVGFVRAVRKTTVTSEQTVSLDVALDPSANVLDEIVVTGSVIATERKAIPTPITVITAEEIERRGVTRIDEFLRGEVPGVLALEQGATVYSSDSLGAMATARVYARGSADYRGNANPLKVYVDGVELLDPAYLGTIDPQSIDRMEIITGPQAATIYGSGAMGGVMQIFTKRGTARQRLDVTLNVRYGMLESNLSDARAAAHNHSLNIAGGTGPQFSYTASASYNYSGQWIPLLFSRRYGASVGATHTAGKFVASGAFSTTLGQNGTVGEIFYSVQMRNRLGDVHTSWASTAAAPVQKVSKSASHNLSLNMDYTVSPLWQHHATLGRSQTNFDIVPEMPRYKVPADTLYSYRSSTGSRITASYNMNILPARVGPMSNTLTLGANGSSGDRTQYTGCAASGVATSFIGCGYRNFVYEVEGVSVSKTLNDQSWGGFGQWRLGMFDQIYLTLGLRAERNPTYGRSHKTDWTPTNGLTYTMEMGDLSIKLLGSYGRATRAPTAAMRDAEISFSTAFTPSQYLSRQEAPFLRPERSRGPQGGIELYYGNFGSITVNHYQQTVDDLIQSIKVDSIPRVRNSDGVESFYSQYRYVNFARVRQVGWEGTGSLNLGPLSMRGTYSWNDSRVTVGVSQGSGTWVPGNMFPGLPTHTGNFTIQYAQGNTSVSLVTNYVGSSLQWGGWLYYEKESMRQAMYVSRELVATNGTWASLYARPGYAKSNLAASQRLSSRISLLLNITNLGNSFGTEEDIIVPALGRQTTIGLSLRPTRR